MVLSRSSAMPLLSRMSPMKVKNGTASSVSFDMMPKIRSGSAPNSAGVSNPSSMPRKPNDKPIAASANETGYPNKRNTTSAANMSGAMLAMRNCVILRLRRARWPVPAGPRAFPADPESGPQEGDALDQFGETLKRQQEEADRNQKAGRPADQAAPA